MKLNSDSTWAIIGAMIVLFTAMIDARISSILSFGLLIALAIYKIVADRNKQPHP